MLGAEGESWCIISIDLLRPRTAILTDRVLRVSICDRRKIIQETLHALAALLARANVLGRRGMGISRSYLGYRQAPHSTVQFTVQVRILPQWEVEDVSMTPPKSLKLEGPGHPKSSDFGVIFDEKMGFLMKHILDIPKLF